MKMAHNLSLTTESCNPHTTHLRSLADCVLWRGTKVATKSIALLLLSFISPLPAPAQFGKVYCGLWRGTEVAIHAACMLLWKATDSNHLAFAHTTPTHA